MKQTTKIITAITLFITSIGACGCLGLVAVAGGGAAGVRELTDASAIYEGTAENAEKGVRKAVLSLNGRLNETVREEGKGPAGKITLRGKTFDDERLTIDIEPTSTKTVMVDIRVGMIGDKDRAKQFHSEIRKFLTSADVK